MRVIICNSNKTYMVDVNQTDTGIVMIAPDPINDSAARGAFKKTPLPVLRVQRYLCEFPGRVPSMAEILELIGFHPMTCVFNGRKFERRDLEHPVTDTLNRTINVCMFVE